MILPIYAYGQTVLKKVAKELPRDFADLDQLISDMWETMYIAKGIGLAAPQIGQSIQLFIIDTKQLEDEDDILGHKLVFINPTMIEEKGSEVSFEEGCLSIPEIRGDVTRLSTIVINYFDENFERHEASFDGITARVIQHEYDHIHGKLFTEMLPPLKKRLIKKRLANIKKGNIESDYRMRFAKA